MKRRLQTLGSVFALSLFMLGTYATHAAAQFRIPPGPCPKTREFIIPEMKTTPADGRAYQIQRHYARMPVDRLIRAFGGPDRARGVARATKRSAQRKLAAGATGTLARHYHDTVLRADALLLILECRQRPGA